MESLNAHVEPWLASGERVRQIQWNGQNIWLKRAPEQARKPVLPGLRRWLARLSGNPLYQSTEATDILTVAGEEARLKYLAANGIRVPEVIAATDTWLAVTDIGPSMRHWLTVSELSGPARRHMLQAAAAELARLHRQGRWHGRPALKDMTWDGEQVGFIDFEEDPGVILTREQCQVRDILIFAAGLYRFFEGHAELPREVLAHYAAQAPDHIWEQAISTARSMWLVYGLLSVLRPVAGKDGRQVWRALRYFRRQRSARRGRWVLALLLCSQVFWLAQSGDS